MLHLHLSMADSSIASQGSVFTLRSEKGASIQSGSECLHFAWHVIHVPCCYEKLKECPLFAVIVSGCNHQTKSVCLLGMYVKKV